MLGEETKKMKLKINSVNPAQPAPPCARRPCRAKTRNAPTPQSVAEKIVKLADPKLEVTGKLFDVRQDRFLDYHMPS